MNQLCPGLGRVPYLRVRVQLRVLVICVSTSTSTWLLHESESEYWLMSTSTSTSTGIWSTFYIKSSIAFFILWRGNPQILINLRQSYNFPLSMQIPVVNLYLFNYFMQFDTMTLQFTYCDLLAVVADNYNMLPAQKQKATRMWNMISCLQCVLSRNLTIFKVATWHYRCRHNFKNNCIWDNLQYCLLVPRSPSKPVMLTIDLQSRKVLFIEIVFWHV